MNEIIIKTEFIKLQQLLKLTGVINQGSDIKLYIKENKIMVNNIIATERGKKIYHGDVVMVKDIGKFKVIRKQ
ncbi:RNA-binding S4 domain-containing protein [Lachnospiraceae bacterium 46-61]